MAIDSDPRASQPHHGYDGKAGRTHVELVHVLTAEGDVELAKIHRAVNVETDPELEESLLDGSLNRDAKGRELAVPVVYHHPAARRFVLLVPYALAHEALRLRAQLMLRVADEGTFVVPPYVIDCTTLVGLPALRALLGLRNTGVGVDSELSELRQREEVLARRVAELEAAQIRVRERETVLEQLPDGGDDSEAVRYGGVAPGGWQEVQPLAATALGATVVGAMPVAEAFAKAARDNSAFSTRPPPLRPSRSSGQPPPLRKRSSTSFPAVRGASDDQQTVVAPFPTAPEARAEHSGPPPLPDAWAETVAVESLPPPLPRGTGTGTRPPTLPSDGDLLEVSSEDSDEQEPISPPENFDSMASGEMAFLVSPSPWLFVRFDEAPLDVHREHRDLLVQYQDHEGQPVVVLSLLLGYGENEQVHRAILNPLHEDARDLLEALQSAYQAKVSMYLDDDYLETRDVASLREGVVTQVLQRAASAMTSDQSWEDLVAQVWDNLPPVHSDDMPFGPPKRQAASTATILAAVERLSRWMHPAKLDEAALMYSVPDHVIEASTKRYLGAAASFGIALPPDLVERAIKHGVAADAPTLVRTQLANFAKKVRDGSNDLDPEWTAANWQRLLESADRVGTEVDPDIMQLSTDASDPAGHGKKSRTELHAALNKAAERVSAAEELLRRHDVSSLPEIVQALTTLEPTEVARLMARVVQIGDEAGDAVLAGLNSPSPAVRQSAALALGRLRLRRALGPLLKLLQSEHTDLWTEVARAIGEFGPSAVRTVTRAAQESRSGDARFAQVLAHLAIHGALGDVRKQEHASDGRLAKIARDASARVSRVKWEDAIVRDGGALPEPNPEAELAQDFFRELQSVPGL